MMTDLSATITEQLLSTLRHAYALTWHGIHGFDHWLRVWENGRRLAETTGADLAVVELFAFIHDIKRENDGRDPQHGQRAADFALTLRGGLIDLKESDFEKLIYACAHHTAGLTEGDVTVRTCWDADRLDLGRVNITPDPKRLCTAAARRPEVLSWAIRRSKGKC